jgi:flagellar biosynthesis/type III secretory pathway chaperone
MRFELQAFLQPVDLTQNVLRTFEQALARRGQPDAALDAIEQQKAQFLLQTLDLPRQRRLRDAQIVAGFPKILPAGGLNKVAELAQVHVTSPFLVMPIFDQSDDNSILS